MQLLPATLISINEIAHSHLAVHQVLRQALCATAVDGACNCQICQLLVTPKQLHFVRWLDIESSYGVSTADKVLNFVALQANAQQRYFCVIEFVERMTTGCANRLLKTLEEPPLQYYFVFTTLNAQQVLPTIKSRCLQLNFKLPVSDAVTLSPIVQAILQLPANDNLEQLFELIEATQEDHVTTMQEFYQLYAQLQRQAMQTTLTTTTQAFAQRALQICWRFARMPAAPGSSKIFWKSLVLALI